MKKFMLTALMVIGLTACNYNRVTQVQHGVVVDVEYSPAHTTMQPIPIRVGKVTTIQMRPVRHPEYWSAHIHYEDSICVHEKFDRKVCPGDSVTRTITIYEHIR